MSLPVQDAVGYRGISDLLVLVRQWHLRRQDQRATLITVITDLQEVAALGVFQWRHGKVVQQQNIGSGESDQKAADIAVGMRYR